MNKECNSYVYFALKGDDFNPQDITNRLGLEPTASWRKGDEGKYNPSLKYACWEISTNREKYTFDINLLIHEIIAKLKDKMDVIRDLKREYDLCSVLEIVMYVDVNPDELTPILGHDFDTIEFLYHTKTTTDVDIYTFDSREE